MIFMTISPVTCLLDPSPLFKASQEMTSGWLHVMVNSSLKERVVFPALKESVACLLFKKPSLDPIVLDNFHPIQHSVLGKVVKKGVRPQLQRALEETDNMNHFQSVFRPRQSTDTVWNPLVGKVRMEMITVVFILLELLVSVSIMTFFWTRYRAWE